MDTPSSSSEPNPAVESADLSGITISGQANVTARDIIGRDKIIHGDEYIGYTAAQVTVLLDKIRTEYQSKPFDGSSPYIGLASFQERDADKFFGRETLTAELVTRVAASAASNARAVFVAGPSGSGKSSLVRAGLVPALKQSKVAGSEHWLYETLKPGRKPLEELGRVAASFAAELKARQDVETRGLNDATILHQWADIALKDDAQRRAVIVIDQFEEIFTQLAPDRENERVAFLNLLTRAATVENGRVLVIFTLRSDFVSNCASYPNLNALVNQQFIQVGTMTPDELVSAIARPAYQVGLRIDPALISQIVNDVRGEPGALPLMQFALQDLFEAEKQKGELTLDGYLARGGLHQALERHADAEFAKLDDSEKQLARSVFSGLVEIGRGREDTKRTALFGELVPAGTDAARVKTLVTKLADARLITTDEEDGHETVTLAHERLIDAWDWLRKLVDENRDAIALQNEIAEDAQEWETHQRDESYLFRGARLATAQEKLQQNQLVLSGPAQEFVETSMAARERERAEREAARQRELEQAQALAAEQKQRAEEQLAANKRLRQRNLFLASAFVFALFAVIAALYFLTQSNDQRNIANRANATSEAEAHARGTAESNALAQSTAANQAKETAIGEADISQSKSLAAQSVTIREQDLALAYLLGIEAYNKHDTYEARRNLFNLRFENVHRKGFLWGHPSRVTSMAFSPDGKTLASRSCGEPDSYSRCPSGEILLWDVTTQQQAGELRVHTEWVNSVAFSPDGKTLVSGSCGLRGPYNSCLSGEILFWDVRTQQRVGGLNGHMDYVESVAFSPDGKTLASKSCGKRDNNDTCEAGMILLWDLATKQRVGELQYVTGAIESLAFSPDGKSLASGSEDGAILLWDVATQQLMGEFGRHPSRVTSIAFSPDGKTLASSSSDNGILLWDVATKQQVGALQGHAGGAYSVAFSPNGKTLASGSFDGTIILWDVASKQIVDELKGGEAPIAFSPDGKTLASGGYDNTILLWDMTPQQYVAKLSGHKGAIYSAAFSPDSKTLASGSGDNTILLWNVTSHQQVAELEEHSAVVKRLAFSPDGKSLASGSEDGAILLWNVAMQQLMGEFGRHAAGVNSVAFSPDGKILASSGLWTILLWDVATQKQVGMLQGDRSQAYGVAFSPDGKTLASGRNDKEIPLWDVASKQQVGALQGHAGAVYSVAFSPNGKTLASGSSDGTIILWDMPTKQRVGESKAQLLQVNSVAFSPDGKTLASGSGDETILLWDVATQEKVGEFKGHADVVWSVAFSPDGRFLASGSDDHKVLLWDVDPQSWLAGACKIVNRNFTHKEYALYVSRDARAYDIVYAKNPTCPGLPVEPMPTPTPAPTP